LRRHGIPPGSMVHGISIVPRSWVLFDMGVINEAQNYSVGNNCSNNKTVKPFAGNAPNTPVS